MMSMSKAIASESRATAILWAKAPTDVRLVVSRGPDVPVDVAEIVQSVAPEFRRSEEHTSELQSLTNLVCRLLLEKKTLALKLFGRTCHPYQTAIIKAAAQCNTL